MRYFQTASSRWLAGAVLLVALLIVISVALSALDPGDDDLLPAGAAEGTVQRYLVALRDDEVDEAYGYVSGSLKETCTLQHFIETTSYQRDRDFSAVVKDTHIADGTYVVEVEITEPNYAPPFGSGGYSFTLQFTLQQEDDAWVFSDPPWPMSWCPEERVAPGPAQSEASNVTLESPLTRGETA